MQYREKSIDDTHEDEQDRYCVGDKRKPSALQGYPECIDNAMDNFIEPKTFVEHIGADDSNDNNRRNSRGIEEIRSRVQHHGKAQRYEDHAGYLRVVKQFFQDIIRAFEVWHLVDYHAADARYRDLRLDDRDNIFIFSTVSNKNTVGRPGLFYYLLERGGNPPIPLYHMEVISGNNRDYGVFAFCSEFIINFHCRKNCIDIRVFGISKCQRVCCVQAVFPANRLALDFCLPPDIIVPVNTQDQRPSLHHYRYL